MERVTTEEQATRRSSLHARWLGRIAYREAWALQQALAAARADGRLAQDQLLLLEHDAVLTLGRNAAEAHVLALPDALAARGIEVVRVERGGEVTYHGPGQLVAYPIVALATPGRPATGSGGYATGVRGFVGALEAAMVDTCADLGVAAGVRPGHPGCWVDSAGPLPRKIGALGIRVARGVTFHGIALNLTTRLADFELINPCGMPGLRSTSVAAELDRARQSPGSPEVDLGVARAAAVFAQALARHLRVRLVGDVPPEADATAERDELAMLAAGRDGLAGSSPAVAAGAR